jgi:hypothetical protein
MRLGLLAMRRTLLGETGRLAGGFEPDEAPWPNA